MATVHKNLWAGYPTWFIRTGTSGLYATGISVTDTREIDGEWRVRMKSEYYANDLKNDREHFPVVGNIDIRGIIVDAVQKLEGGEADGN